jgi:heme/copper-type cytochrome/quinol oxidase subunit 2
MIKIKDMDSFKLSYMYFFPVVFFPFLNIYQYRNDADIKTWLFSNFLISITVILVPLFLALNMLITKFLYQDQDKKSEYNSIGLGLLCLIFLMGSNFYQFQKFSVGTDLSIDFYRMALMLSFLIGCFTSSIWFTLKYKKYSKKYAPDFNVCTQRFMVSAFPALLIAITALFSV